MRAGEYSPVTVNNWLRFFRGIMNEAVDELGLEKNPLIKVKGLDTSRARHLHRGGAERAHARGGRPFLAAMRDRHPQHLAMVALGFATGWRPSMMRPLRRKGPSADVLWEKNVVLARRSQTRGDEVREATKNSTRFRVTLPREVMAVLRWHADRLPGRTDAGERSPVSVRDREAFGARPCSTSRSRTSASTSLSARR